jgi:exodeoxyribonuclease VII large subunit
MITDISHAQEIYSISRLNREVRFLLEDQFPILWVEGEISNFSAPHSGHWYFSLKDSLAQVRCAMFRPQNSRMTFIPQNGMHILAKAHVSLYEGRGDFQLIVEFIEELGEGKLQKQFEILKKRLAELGLFDLAHKKKLPAIPKCIGIITSPTGAAIRDILHVIQRRFSCVPVIIYPTLVQGESAAANIVDALQTANRRNECDVLILARGGGSLEDLWPFNEEKVAHAIYQSTIPIISGVGHEIDFTIADFVADVRAATPSVAAELVTPDKEELFATLEQTQKQFARFIKQKLQQLQNHLIWATKNLQQQHPKRRLLQQAQQLDLCEATLLRLLLKQLNAAKITWQMLSARLQKQSPHYPMHELQHRLTLQQHKLQNGMTASLQHAQQQLANLATKLHTLSPLSTLKRGFSITTRSLDKMIVHSVKQVKTGDSVKIQLADGRLDCRVEKTELQ